MVFSTIPIASPKWTQGFGATQFSKENPSFYRNTSGLHGGIDLGADKGTNVYAGLSGTVVDPAEVGLAGDAAPNVIIKSNGYYVVYGHTVGASTLKVGQNVEPDSIIGTVGDQEHVHLAVLKPEGSTWRTYNPLAFFPSDSPIHNLDWNDYRLDGHHRLTMQSFLYTSINFWIDPHKPNAQIGIR